MTLLEMIEMELELRVEKLGEFEKEAILNNDKDDILRFRSRRMELESMQFFIEYHCKIEKKFKES